MSPALANSSILWVDRTLHWCQGGILVAYALAQTLVIVYSSQRYVTLWRWWRLRSTVKHPPRRPTLWPCVTVQLPLYNERTVVERLIDAVGRLDYPASRLEIQILDDSTDETHELACAAAERNRVRGLMIEVLHRGGREGHKAGALAAGLSRARGELIAIFDSDFVPRPDFLQRLVPYFSDPGVGMVQSRWGHLNRDRSMLTAAQAVMLDSHFLLEHEVRMNRGLFFNFNGTAGLWRRSCIEAAGGWKHDTLTEDLDLSYRAQLEGWRFVFDATMESPAELPADIEALKSQQRRWAKGSIQTARKIMPRLLRCSLPWRIKIEAFFHLTSNVAYPLLLSVGILLLPVMLSRSTAPRNLTIALEVALIVLGVLPVSLFLGAGQVEAGRRGGRALRDVLISLVLGIGLSLNNARAVVEGLGRSLGEWQRTPKTGDGFEPRLARPYEPERRGGKGELALALYFAMLGPAAWIGGHPMAIPFVVLLAVGFGTVGVVSMRGAPRGSRRAGVDRPVLVAAPRNARRHSPLAYPPGRPHDPGLPATVARPSASVCP